MQVDELIATRQPGSYDEAVRLLTDLQELSARGDGAVFRRRIEALRAEHARKPLEFKTRFSVHLRKELSRQIA